MLSFRLLLDDMLDYNKPDRNKMNNLNKFRRDNFDNKYLSLEVLVLVFHILNPYIEIQIPDRIGYFVVRPLYWRSIVVA